MYAMQTREVFFEHETHTALWLRLYVRRAGLEANQHEGGGMKIHIFHDWSKWEKYEWNGTVSLFGLLVPKEMHGKQYEKVEIRQRRHCLVCGYSQDRKVDDE
jgi:hypothetical protein